MKRVVITGMGVRTSLGNSVPSLMNSLDNGECGIEYIKEWDIYHGLNSKIAAPSIIEDIKKIPRSARRSMPRSSILATQACEEAIINSGISEENLNSGRTGCILGSTIGSLEALKDAFGTVGADKSIEKYTSMQFFKTLSHADSMNIAQYFKINGCVMSTAAACASSLQAIGTGADLIRAGSQDIMLCGGSEEYSIMATGSFDILFATSTHYNSDPKHSSRPFDANRDGLVCGEGSGILVLEEYERAKKRNATIYGEIIGYNTCGSGAHISQSNQGAMMRCFEQCLTDAKITPDKIDYINAHATATIHGDIEEAQAIKKVFGSNIPVSGLKGNLGHTLGASGAIEIAATLHMMEKNIIYPTLNLDKIDPKCEGIMHITEKIEKKLNCIVKNSFAFGGINATIIIHTV
ncbi:MAG: beta-ketoacyl-[acyl-carrier-protein] synthase family protein [bacterium]|nr:beta-ketoacyl-[acyl-carrier-protein] synthase family protein [bacterium]